MTARELKIRVGERTGEVSALLDLPAKPKALYVLAHGAGAGMRHVFFATLVPRLLDHDVGTLRYQFPYMEQGTGRPDPAPIAEAAVRAAVDAAAREVPGVKLLAGGKSFGGRMTSQAAAQAPLPGVAGLVFLGFPLHAPKRPDDKRAAHLAQVTVPMLFLQGTRDDLADLALLSPICKALGKRATLHVVQGGDHSFKVLKRDGRNEGEVMEELAVTISDWTNAIP
jgi:predicted alpha/beta-hydrolase family hydrolase